MKDRILGKYIAKNHTGNVFTDNELQVIRQGNTDKMVETFLHMGNDYVLLIVLECLWMAI